MVLPFFFPAEILLCIAGPKETKNQRQNSPPDSDPFDSVEFGKNPASSSRQNAATWDRRIQFHKSGQLFIRAHNEALTVTAMRVCNEDRSPVGINRWATAPTPTGFAEIVSNGIPEHFQQLSGSDRNAHEQLTSNGLKSASFLAYRHPLLSNICVMPRPTSIAYRCSRWPGFCIGFRDQRGEKTMGVLWNPGSASICAAMSPPSLCGIFMSSKIKSGLKFRAL